MYKIIEYKEIIKKKIVHYFFFFFIFFYFIKEIPLNNINYNN